jgi:NADH-quinone oxidoreductase subunit M
MPTFERDLVIMSLVIFIPTIFALVLMIPWIFPKGSEEYMRWFSLLGTALTLVISLVLFIDYYNGVYNRNSDPNDRSSSSLRVRAAEQDDRADVKVGPDGASKRSTAGTDCMARIPWIPRFNIDYYLGVDGISMPLILLTTVLSFLAMLASWNIDKHVRGYCILFLILETGMLGTFFALDFFLFYVFWEVMLLPMYFLIGVWGGPRREYAAIKFFLYTLLGSVFILIALLGFYFTNVREFVSDARVTAEAERIVRERLSGVVQKPSEAQIKTLIDKEKKDVVINTFDIVLLQKVGEKASNVIKGETNQGLSSETVNQPFFKKPFQYIMFLLLFVGFAIKVPVFPFHTWLPDAHVEAPTPISMILAGVLLKMGGYGIIRIAYPICPWAAETLAHPIALFGVINIVYGAFAAMAQTDFKKLVAYSSVSHMGYVILGFAVWSAVPKAQYWSWGMNGAMFQMIAHGITSAGMFFLVGVIYDRAHHRNLDNFRGLYEPMPLYGGISAIIFFGAMGLPGMCGFVGEFMVVLATWNYSIVYSVLAAATVVLTAAYILWTLQRVYLGQNPAYKDFPDISFRELLCITPLIVLAILLGVLPNLLLSWMEPSVTGLVDALAQLGR